MPGESPLARDYGRFSNFQNCFRTYERAGGLASSVRRLGLPKCGLNDPEEGKLGEPPRSRPACVIYDEQGYSPPWSNRPEAELTWDIMLNTMQTMSNTKSMLQDMTPQVMPHLIKLAMATKDATALVKVEPPSSGPATKVCLHSASTMVRAKRPDGDDQCSKFLVAQA